MSAKQEDTVDWLCNLKRDDMFNVMRPRMGMIADRLTQWCTDVSVRDGVLGLDVSAMFWWAKLGEPYRTIDELVTLLSGVTLAFGLGTPTIGKDAERLHVPRAYAPSDIVDVIVQAGWARAQLHEGSPIRGPVFTGQLALLASVSEMSVKRGIDSGQLKVARRGDRRYRQTTITIASARAWLKSRDVPGF